MQQVSWWDGSSVRSTTLPPTLDEVVPGVKWGSPDEIMSPAFWALEAQLAHAPTHGFVAQQGSLSQETGFWLLGGFGVKVELAEAYHSRLLGEGVYESPYCNEADLFQLLNEPILLNGRQVRYRFPGQRANRLARVLPTLEDSRFQTSDCLILRDHLQALPGIGPKTASWIVRNWLGSDRVAILDIHLVRACQVMGLFPQHVVLASDYEKLEAAFIRFSEALGVRASVLDAVIWNAMREFRPALIHRLT